MSHVRLDIGGHVYDLAVRDGQEAHFTTLARAVDARCRDAVASTGGLTEVRMLLFAALLLADETQDARVTADELGIRHAALEEAGEALIEQHTALRHAHDSLIDAHEALRAEHDAMRTELASLHAASALPADPAATAPDAPDPAAVIAIERLAARIEAYADGLEMRATAP